MVDIDVDEVREVTYQQDSVRVVFKNGDARVYEGADLPEALAILNHWTPPTA
jgi:hypothetical protein